MLPVALPPAVLPVDVLPVALPVALPPAVLPVALPPIAPLDDDDEAFSSLPVISTWLFT